MDLARINLNLLFALNALLSEQHVSRAAKRLNITQATMSNTLHKLRIIFNDDLLVRSGRKMVLTPRAQSLAPQLNELLQQLEVILATGIVFNPEESTRIFNVSMSDYNSLMLSGGITAKLLEEAPGVRVNIRSSHRWISHASSIFASGEIELAIGTATLGIDLNLPAHLQNELLYDQVPVCAARADHPLMQEELTIEKLAKAKFIDPTGLFEHYVPPAKFKEAKELITQLAVIINLPTISSTVASLECSDALSILPENVTNIADKIVTKPLPFEMPVMSMHQVWPRKYENDPGHKWLREMIRDVAKEVTAAS